MQIDDLRRGLGEQPIETDLCIIGSGPAGLTIAHELRDSGIDILIVESGGLVLDQETEQLSQIESLGVPRVLEQTLVRNRAFGGSSHTWTGRCASFDDMDFAARPWVPFSGWPIGRSALSPFLARSAEILGTSPDRPDGRANSSASASVRPEVDPRLLRSVSWHFSQDATRPADFMRFGPRFLASVAPNVRIVLHATATEITPDPSGSHVQSVEIASLRGPRAIVRPRVVVLCSGALENARLLLCSNRVVPNGLGNAHDVVGRFLMDHPRSTLLQFDLRDAAAIRHLYGPYKLDSARGRHVFVDGLALSPDIQREQELLNCAVWLDEVWASDDPLQAAVRLAKGPRRNAPRDAWTVISQPGYMVRAFGDRVIRGISVAHKLERIGFLCSVEQRPDPESRLRLGNACDPFGLPIAQIDWRISDQEKASLATLAAFIAQEFARLGLPAPKLADWVRHGRHDDAVFVDAAHPTGTTRMSRDPRNGVVDEHCQVHGVEGLYVAGSSVFPTAGHANPTMMIVALAVRLADRLKERHFSRAAALASKDAAVLTR